MKKFVFKNDNLIEEDLAVVSIEERAFLFGDGIFETCKVFNGKIYDFKSHEDRIIKGLKALKIKAKIVGLEKKSLQLIKKNSLQNGLLRISISRGIGSFGYLPSKNCQTLTIIQTKEERQAPKKITLGISSLKKPPRNSLPIHCKTMQALPMILNKISAQEKNIFDAVMLSQKNFISETSSANIFWVKNGKLFTAAKACDILPGTIRARLLKISPLEVFEVKAGISSLKTADEIFLTNSSFLLLSVDELIWFWRGKKMVKKMQKNFGKEFFKLLQNDVEESCKN